MKKHIAKDSVKPFHNAYYFESIYKHMARNNLITYLDGAGVLWHIKDMIKIVTYHRKNKAI